MPIDRKLLILEQSQFYRVHFRRLITLTFALIIITFALVGFIYYQQLTRPPLNYFVTTSEGQLIEINPI